MLIKATSEHVEVLAEYALVELKGWGGAFAGEGDWDDYLNWHTTKIKWMEYDAPWEGDTLSKIEDIRKDFLHQIKISNREIPSRLAISLEDGKAIGSVIGTLLILNWLLVLVYVMMITGEWDLVKKLFECG